MNKPSIIQLPKILDKRGNLSLSDIFDGFCSFLSNVEDKGSGGDSFEI